MRLSGWPVAVVVGVVVAAMIYIAVPVLQSPDQIAVDPPRTGSQRRREDTTAHQTNDYVIPVQRRKNLTYEEFVEEYLETQTPVVIVGVTDEWPSQRWTLDSIAELCGDQKVDLAKRGLDVLNTMDDAARARLSHDLEERHNTTIPEVIAQLQQGMDFQEFAEYIRSRRHIDGGNLWRGFPLERSFAKYLLPYNIHDQCIREEENGFCPELLSEVSISPFFRAVGANQTHVHLAPEAVGGTCWQHGLPGPPPRGASEHHERHAEGVQALDVLALYVGRAAAA